MASFILRRSIFSHTLVNIPEIGIALVLLSSRDREVVSYRSSVRSDGISKVHATQGDSRNAFHYVFQGTIFSLRQHRRENIDITPHSYFFHSLSLFLFVFFISQYALSLMIFSIFYKLFFSLSILFALHLFSNPLAPPLFPTFFLCRYLLREREKKTVFQRNK